MKKGNNDLTELVFVLDRSGSMHGLEEDTVGGFNAMLEKQRRAPGRALVSTILFNGQSEVLHDRLPLDRVPLMDPRTFTVGGCTALVDALAGAIRHIGRIHHYARPVDVPAHTVFVVITDGCENASRRYTADQLRALVEKEQEQYGWEFLFLGANMDAVKEAARFGISSDRAVRFENDAQGVAVNYHVVSETLSRMREAPCCASIGAEWKEQIEADFQKRHHR